MLRFTLYLRNFFRGTVSFCNKITCHNTRKVIWIVSSSCEKSQSELTFSAAKWLNLPQIDEYHENICENFINFCVFFNFLLKTSSHKNIRVQLFQPFHFSPAKYVFKFLLKLPFSPQCRFHALAICILIYEKPFQCVLYEFTVSGFR